MRSLTIPLILIGIFAVSGSVLANEVIYVQTYR